MKLLIWKEVSFISDAETAKYHLRDLIETEFPRLYSEREVDRIRGKVLSDLSATPYKILLNEEASTLVIRPSTGQ